MSATLKNIYGAIPATTRGKSVLVGGDPKGKNWLYTCGSTVFIRDIRDPLKTEIYSEHQHQTTVARYAPSGFYIASGDVAGNIRIWDTTQAEHILKIELKILSGPILDLQWSDDSKRIVAVGEGKEKFGSVFLFDSGSSVGEITGHSKAITSCDFKQTRPYRVATVGEDMLVNWFEGPPFKFKKSNKDHSRFVNCVRFSPDGSKMLTVGSDKTGFFFDGKTGDVIGKLNPDNGHTAGIYACSWSSDSKRVLTASADKTCKIWDAETGNCLTTFTVSDNPQVEDQQLGCLWQGDEIISIALSGYVYYHDINNPNKPKRVVHGHNKFITSLAFDSSSNALYSASYDASVIRWDVASGSTEVLGGKGHTNQINRVLLQGDSLVTVAMDDSLRVTSLNTKQYGEAITLEKPPSDVATGKKDVILVAVVDSVVVVRGGKIVNKHPVKYQPTAIALSVDEHTVAVGGKDNNIYLYKLNGDSLSDGEVLKGHRGPVSSLSYSPDGKHLASSDTNRDIFVWDLANNQIKIQGWQFHTAKVNRLAWTADSMHLASGSLDGSIYVWSVADPSKRIANRDAHRGGVNDIVWVDANTLASCGQDCTVKTWSIKFH